MIPSAGYEKMVLGLLLGALLFLIISDEAHVLLPFVLVKGKNICLQKNGILLGVVGYSKALGCRFGQLLS